MVMVIARFRNTDFQAALFLRRMGSVTTVLIYEFIVEKVLWWPNAHARDTIVKYGEYRYVRCQIRQTRIPVLCGWRLTLVKQLEAQPAEMAIARDLVVADDPLDLGGQADPER